MRISAPTPFFLWPLELEPKTYERNTSVRPKYNSSFFIRQERWIMEDFPKMAVRILEITAVAAPESLPGRHRDVRSRLLSTSHYLINFGFAGYVVTNAKLSGTARCRIDSRI